MKGSESLNLKRYLKKFCKCPVMLVCNDNAHYIVSKTGFPGAGNTGWFFFVFFLKRLFLSHCKLSVRNTGAEEEIINLVIYGKVYQKLVGTPNCSGTLKKQFFQQVISGIAPVVSE